MPRNKGRERQVGVHVNQRDFANAMLLASKVSASSPNDSIKKTALITFEKHTCTIVATDTRTHVSVELGCESEVSPDPRLFQGVDAIAAALKTKDRDANVCLTFPSPTRVVVTDHTGTTYQSRCLDHEAFPNYAREPRKTTHEVVSWPADQARGSLEWLVRAVYQDDNRADMACVRLTDARRGRMEFYATDGCRIHFLDAPDATFSAGKSHNLHREQVVAILHALKIFRTDLVEILADEQEDACMVTQLTGGCPIEVRCDYMSDTYPDISQLNFDPTARFQMNTDAYKDIAEFIKKTKSKYCIALLFRHSSGQLGLVFQNNEHDEALTSNSITGNVLEVKWNEKEDRIWTHVGPKYLLDALKLPHKAKDQDVEIELCNLYGEKGQMVVKVNYPNRSAIVMPMTENFDVVSTFEKME